MAQTENSPKVALITGASRGLGAALAESLAPTHHIVALARTGGALEELDDRIKALGGEATLAPMDVTNSDAMAHLCRAIFDRWGHLDLWIHTAVHAAPLTPTAHMVEKDFDKSMAVNATATGKMIPMIAPLLDMAPTRAQAVFFDDPTAGAKFYGAYGASKAAQVALARSWQAEAANIGPKVHIVTPEPMPTATRARFHPGEDRAPLKSTASQAAAVLKVLGL